ncbi:hypothetical protein MNB_SUP05-SYMBIONT-5-419 [hydrothermal vent metagenome]|uniref:Uncharacterized protein n=1 Tax=hydrothermal vent metagenome TaxID=652676 RepID=A0A1W1E7A9_9ZZZZ
MIGKWFLGGFLVGGDYYFSIFGLNGFIFMYNGRVLGI